MKSNALKKCRWDLGVRSLGLEWKNFFSFLYLREDLIAGVTVACVAIPLSLAIALASGVDPAVGLVTAIVGSIIAALMGGTPLAVSGPAVAMAVLLASIVATQGLQGLLIVGIGCGILQIFTGFCGLGKFVRFVPVPVITGFTAGIGAIILIGQLPRALGLPAPDESHVIDVITHVTEVIHQTHTGALILSLLTLTIIFVLPKLFKKIPATLVAVIIPSLISYYLFPKVGMSVEVIGEIPSSLPQPQLPQLSFADMTSAQLGKLLLATLMVYLLASLETLLSSSALDKLAKNQRHDPDQELIGQGLGNMAVSFFGGIPITGVIARSALNVQSGAKTRRSAIFHALILIGAVYTFSGLIEKIPIAVLAGVLLSVAMRMLSPMEFLELWSTARAEAITHAVTFTVIVLVDLIIGVKAGVAAAVIIAAIRLGQSRAAVHILEGFGPYRIAWAGPMTFMSTGRIEELRIQSQSFNPEKGLVIDCEALITLDASAAEQLKEFIESLFARGMRVAIKGLPAQFHRLLAGLHHPTDGCSLLAATESDVCKLLGDSSDHKQGLDRLRYGVEKFQNESRLQYEALFEKLAGKQEPHTLFITCSDSRINPNLITSTEPGELFIVRNIGAIIPCHNNESNHISESAAIEFAVKVLKVREIIVCGHSACGAMNAIMSEEIAQQVPAVSRWLNDVKSIRQELPERATPDEAAQLCALRQIENIRTYPIVQERLRNNEVRLHAWFYNIGKAELEAWDDKEKRYIIFGAEAFSQDNEFC